VAKNRALYAGLRRNEIWRLRWENIDLNNGNLVAQSKRGAPRTIPLAAPLLEKLKKSAKPVGNLFRFSDNKAIRVLWRLQKALPDLDAQRLSWNCWRHTFCSLLVQAGVSIDKVACWAGHNPAVCRAHYVRFTPKSGRDSDIDRL